jgi:hypothetical protein
MVYQLCHKLDDRSLTPAVCGKHQNWVPCILLTSESKKPGQIAVVYHYYDLSRFFWLRRYIVCDLFSWGLSKKKFCLKKQNPKWPTQKNSVFQNHQFSKFFCEIFMDWSCMVERLCNINSKTGKKCIFCVFGWQPHNHIAWATSFCISQS